MKARPGPSNMKSQLNGKSQLIFLRATQPGYGFSVVLVSVLLCLMGQRVGAGILVATGDNGHGQLGDGTINSTNRLSPVLGIGDVTAFAAGGSSAYAIQNGALYAWGYNSDGQLGNGTNTESHAPVPVSGLDNGVTAVTAGLRHALAIRNGIVYGWGYNGTGALGNGSFDYALNAIPTQVIGLTGVVAIAAGDYDSFALQNGAVYAWGWDDAGELGTGSGMANVPVPVIGMTNGVTAIAAGEFFGMAIKNGALWVWGAGSYGQLGTGGSGNAYSPVQVTNLNSGVTAIAAGNSHGLAVKNGVVYAWGRNYSGEVGNGGWSSIYQPLAVGGLPTNIVELAAGYWSSYARSADGRLWAWGNGLEGQSGTGYNYNYNTVQEVHAPDGYRFTSIAIDASGHFALARLAAVSESSVVLSLSWSNSAPCLSVSGVVGERYALEYASALPPNNNWQRLDTNTFTGIPWIVTDTSAAGNATRFYRAVRLP